MRALFVLLSTVIAVVVLAGCDSAPDRGVEADALESRLRHVPGVAEASTSYEHGGSRGSAVTVDVSMPDATDAQVVDLVREMDDTMGDDFDRYHVDITVSLGPRVQLRSTGKMQPGPTARDVAIGRAMEKGVDARSVAVFQAPGGPRVDIREATDSQSAVATAIEAIGGVPAGIEAYPVDSPDQRSWDVTMPLSVDDFRTMASRVDRLPARAFAVAIRDGHVSRLSVGVDASESDALTTLRSIVDDLGAGPDRPLYLNWTSQADAVGTDRRDSGSVTVGGCGYPESAGEQDPQKYFTDAALAVQKQMRSEYDTCRR